jgi:DNA-binding NarL/FixJ family response regulator
MVYFCCMINLLVNCKIGKDGQLKVLLIEDCHIVGQKIAKFISENPKVYVLGQARTVGEALKMFNEFNPDAIILDINLPDGNGMDTLIHLKRLKPSLKVVVFSNAANEIYRRKFMEKGSDFFLDKSKDFNKIPEVIGQIISSREGNDYLYLLN